MTLPDAWIHENIDSVVITTLPIGFRMHLFVEIQMLIWGKPFSSVLSHHSAELYCKTFRIHLLVQNTHFIIRRRDVQFIRLIDLIAGNKISISVPRRLPVSSRLEKVRMARVRARGDLECSRKSTRSCQRPSPCIHSITQFIVERTQNVKMKMIRNGLP